MQRTISVLLLVPATFVVASCSDEVCTEIGCGPPLEVRFRGATSEPGLYRIEMTAEGIPHHCEITIPFSCDAQPACTSPRFVWAPTLSGCGHDAGRQSLDGFAFFREGPSSLEVLVHRDGYLIGNASVEPMYEETRPNGPECEPRCRTAPRLEVELVQERHAPLRNRR
jgi:hypothetical protein